MAEETFSGCFDSSFFSASRDQSESLSMTNWESCSAALTYPITNLPILLMMEDPHHPAGDEHSHHEDSEAVTGVAHHLARVIALGNPKDDGSEEGKNCSG